MTYQPRDLSGIVAYWQEVTRNNPDHPAVRQLLLDETALLQEIGALKSELNRLLRCNLCRGHGFVRFAQGDMISATPCPACRRPQALTPEQFARASTYDAAEKEPEPEQRQIGPAYQHPEPDEPTWRTDPEKHRRIVQQAIDAHGQWPSEAQLRAEAEASADQTRRRILDRGVPETGGLTRFSDNLESPTPGYHDRMTKWVREGVLETFDKDDPKGEFGSEYIYYGPDDPRLAPPTGPALLDGPQEEIDD